MAQLVDLFINKLGEKLSYRDELQKKYLKNWELSRQEIEDLEDILRFFTRVYGDKKCSIEQIADAYIFINEMIWEETYYFMISGQYRYSKVDEVVDIVYNNKKYMEKYMMGLTISEFIWTNHIEMIRYFVEKLELLKGARYLEIGPGFGQYLIKAVLSGEFEEYRACDLSSTSVEGSNEYLRYKNVAKKCVVECKNFYDYDLNEKFDCIVMGEVLEHVENPLEMLKKIYELLDESGKTFITTVINAPAIDHIFLFDTIESVLEMVRKADFKVIDYCCSTEGKVSLEKAIKKKKAINIAMILEK